MMELLDEEPCRELLERMQAVLDEEDRGVAPRSFSSDDVHHLLECWWFVVEPLHPLQGTAYVRYHPDLPKRELHIIIEPEEPVDRHTLRVAVNAVQEVERLVDSGEETP